MSDTLRRSAETSYDEFKRKHPDLIAAAEAELEVTEEIARLTAEVERLQSRINAYEVGQEFDGEKIQRLQGVMLKRQAVVDAARRDVYAAHKNSERVQCMCSVCISIRTLDGERAVSKSVQRRLEIQGGEWEPGGKAYNECPDCVDGIAPRGGHEGSTRYVCPTCGGEGGVKLDLGAPVFVVCPTCGGSVE